MGPPPAVAQVRVAVRAGLGGLPPGSLVLAACSGGADSLALAAGLAHEAPRCGLRGGAITVDHGLQPGSRARAATVSGLLLRLGLNPVHAIAVRVPAASGHGGPEAAARDARYQALDQSAATTGAAAILLGHSRDDQAEAVLLGLARGSGGRSLAGMPERRGVYRRPLLGLPRETLRAACRAQGLCPWDDPHNADPAFRRARIRHAALPALEDALGPGVRDSLARTAALLRHDADLLAELAGAQVGRISDGQGGWDTGALAELHPALRGRVLRTAAVAAGCSPGSVTAAHVAALDALVTGWRGQRWTDLPGGIRGMRRYGKLIFTTGHRGGRPHQGEAEDLVGRE